MSVDEAVTKALTHSPAVAQAKRQLEAARRGKKEALTYMLPSFSASYGWERIQDPKSFSTPFGEITTQAEETYTAKVSVYQPLFTGFKLLSTYQAASAAAEAARWQLQSVKLTVARQTRVACYQLMAARKALEVAEQAVELLEAHLRTARQFHANGILPLNDVLKVEVELASARQKRLKAANTVVLMRNRLNTLMGRALDAPVALDEGLGQEPVEITYAQAMATAKANRPELKAIDAQIARAKRLVARARSGYYPSLGLSAAYEVMSDSADLGDSNVYDHTNWSVGAEISWNFWEWGRTAHKVGQARAELMRLKAMKRQILEEIQLEVKQAIVELTQAWHNISTAATAVRQAKENYRITRERYRQQLTTNTELLDARTLLTQARNDYFSALAGYNIAIAKLRWAMGQGLPEQPRR